MSRGGRGCADGVFWGEGTAGVSGDVGPAFELNLTVARD